MSIAKTVIVVHSLATINKLLQGAWSRFTTALAAADVDAALTMLAGERTRRKYGQVLTAIRSDLPEYVASIESVRPMWIGDDFAHYLLVRLENGSRYAYHVYFVRDAAGVWKVMQF